MHQRDLKRILSAFPHAQCAASELIVKDYITLLQVADAEAALKAGMAKVSELESRAAAAPEPVRYPAS